MKTIFGTCLASLLALVISPLSFAEQENSQPNILWIVTDDHRPDSIRAYNQAMTGQSESPLGYVSSPVTDKLIAEGVLFTQAYNQSPACGPSRASMHTGRYPFRSGKYAWEAMHQEVDISRPTLSQTMREAGYGTALIGKSHHGVSKFRQNSPEDIQQRRENNKTLRSDIFDFELDFSRDLERNGIGDLVSTGAYGLKDGVLLRKDSTETIFYPTGEVKEYVLTKEDRLLTEEETAIKAEVEKEFDILRAYTRINTGLILGGENPRPAGETIDASIVKEFKNHLSHAGKSYKTLWGKEVEGANNDKPLFVNLGFHLPHTPVLPPKKFRDQFKNKKYKIPAFDTEELSTWPGQLLQTYNESKTDAMKDNEKLQAIRDYYAFTAYGDALIGEAVEAFKEYSEKQEREWLIVYTVGDHGWHLGEQGIMAKFGPWKQSLNGAVIVVSSDKKSWPAGKIIDEFVEYVDFAPTFFSAAGEDVEKPEYEYLDGLDLAEVLNDSNTERDYILGEMNLVHGHRAFMRTKHFAFSMRTRNRRTIAASPSLNDNVLWALETDPMNVDLALYDLRADPLERKNVAYTQEYLPLSLWFREKLGKIVLGDGRAEVDWSKANSYNISRFAGGADDKKIDIPAEIIPEVNENWNPRPLNY
ncbi:sulfatase-like hydrolase/transferase [Hirschia litorea]|uniref:Sulfatase-like hydrolase/transferase n=1 Tax=Hirschia litorea TaxID=1199156 RepID=A0ABW2INU1_9PROT